jgi:hypothetical protein
VRTLSAPARGEDAPHRLLQPTRRHVHLQLDRSKPDVRAACAVGTPVEDKLRRAARVMGRLTALHELRKHVLVARRVPRAACAAWETCFAGAARSWWGPDRGPLGLRPLARGVFFRVPRESSSSGVLPTTNARRNAHPPPEAAYLDASSKAPLRLLPDAFHRRMPARPDACAPNLEREPATEPRFCHPVPGFRRSFAPSPREGEEARPCRFPGAHRSGALEATRRPSTSANETIRKHDHRTIDTRPRMRRRGFRLVVARCRSAVRPPCIPV